MKHLILYCLCCSSLLLKSQVKVIPIEVENFKSSMRGLYVINETTAWASGTGGVVMKTTDGKMWKADTIPGCRNLDFRDIHAFDTSTAIVISAGDSGKIYRTADGGKNWELVYQNTEPGTFFDGMDFWDRQHGIAFSDPIDNSLYLIETLDGGKKWRRLIPENIPGTLAGEAGFAASGTSIVCMGDSTVWIATGGGEKSRVFKSINRGRTWNVNDTPLNSAEGTGIFSMAFMDEKNGVIVGGNYLDSTNASSNCAVTEDGGETWQLISNQQPGGYRSCVGYNGNKILIACGRSGTDISLDKGKTWKLIDNEGYYSCFMTGKTGWFTGRKGKVAKIIVNVP